MRRLFLKYLPTPIVRFLWRVGETGVHERAGVRLLLNRFSYTEGTLLKRSELPPTYHLIADSVRQGDVVVDIGANVGLVSFLCARGLQKAGKVFAFEPDTFVFRRLCRNIHLNHMQNTITPIQLALSDHVGRADFASVAWGNLGEGTLEMSVTQVREKVAAGKMRPISVDVTTMDDWCIQSGVKNVDIVKIDVEGHEFSVLQGMRGIAAKSPRLRIFVDCHPDMGVAVGEILQLLNEWGMAVVGWDFPDDTLKIVESNHPRFQNVTCIAAYMPAIVPAELKRR